MKTQNSISKKIALRKRTITKLDTVKSVNKKQSTTITTTSTISF
ncbi:class I lanthipeptide [Chondrinema litorale]